MADSGDDGAAEGREWKRGEGGASERERRETEKDGHERKKRDFTCPPTPRECTQQMYRKVVQK